MHRSDKCESVFWPQWVWCSRNDLSRRRGGTNSYLCSPQSPGRPAWLHTWLPSVVWLRKHNTGREFTSMIGKTYFDIFVIYFFVCCWMFAKDHRKLSYSFVQPRHILENNERKEKDQFSNNKQPILILSAISTMLLSEHMNELWPRPTIT